MAEQWERTMPCKDALGRDRDIRVFISGEDGVTVGLNAPPGEVALLTPTGIAALTQLLHAAAVEATHRGAVWG